MKLRLVLLLFVFGAVAVASDYDDYDDQIDDGAGDVTSLLKPQLPSDDELGFIITFKEPQLPGTTQQVLTQVHQTLEEDGTANATTTNLTVTSSIETQPSSGGAASGGTGDANVRGFVVDLGSVDQSSALKALQNNSLVGSVFRDRWVTVADAGPSNAAAPAAATSSAAAADTAAAPAAAGAAAAGQAAACVSPLELSSGLTGGLNGSLAPSQWNSACVNRRNRLVWVGQRCRSNLTQIQYIAIIALDKASNQTAMNGRKPCVLKYEANQQDRWNLQRFGTCGRAPLLNPSLPICVGRGSCVKTALGAPIPLTGSVPVTANMTVSGVKCGGKAVSSLTYEGVSCGPNNTHIIWRAAVAPGGCRITNKLFEQLQSTPASRTFLAGVQPAELQATLEVFGLGCGSPPRAAAKALALSRFCRGKEPLPPGDHKLARKPLRPGQQVPWGINRIGAFLAGQGIPDTSPGSVTQEVTVAVFDTGIWPHPDLNVVGGTSFVTWGNANETNAAFDGHGHGTHVAGIVGANGGLVGVSPGVSLYSVKVMQSTGLGKLQDLLNALAWLVDYGRDNGILVAVMSLSVQYPEGWFGYEAAKSQVCNAITDVTKEGIVVVVAAGNNNLNYDGRMLPANCPNAVVVTALNATNDGPAPFSNWISDKAQPEDKENVFAAPGFAQSTVPPQINNTTYALLQGTSQAAPHVAGVFANCFMSGACQGTNFAQSAMQTVKADSVRRLTDQSRWQPYGFAGDGNNTVNGSWRGFLVFNAY